MNVMKVAHNQAKLIKVGTDMTYRQALSVALKQTHRAYKAMQAQEFTMEQQAGIKHCQDEMKAQILKDIVRNARKANHAAIDIGRRPHLITLAADCRADRDNWMAEARKLKG